MDARQVALVQDSFEKVVLLGEKVADIFYAELFAIDPALRTMFKGDMGEQRKKLLATLVVVVRSLHAPNDILQPVRNLAIKHVSYGVKPEHYTLVGNALLRTLKKSLGEKYTSDVREAWVEAFRIISCIMKQAAYGEASTRIKGVA